MAAGGLGQESATPSRFLPVIFVQKQPRVSAPAYVHPLTKIDGMIDPESGKVRISRESHETVLKHCGFCIYDRKSRFGESQPEKYKLGTSSDVEDCVFTCTSDEESAPKRFKVEDPGFKENSLMDIVELLPVEAFYCVYVLKCLKVNTVDNEVLDPQNMWLSYYRADSSFIPSFVGYSYLRQNGWVVMNGMKFGVDFLVYRGGPEAYHSSYCVKIRVVNTHPSNEEVMVVAPTSIDCREVVALQRVAEGTGKLLLILDVLVPSCFTSEVAANPSCVAMFRVQEMVVKRWMAGKERT